MKIRKAKKEDLETLVESYINFLKQMGKFVIFVKDKEDKINKKQLKNFLAKRIKPNDKKIFLVAEDNKKLIGFVEAEIISSRESETDKKVLEVVDIYAENKRKGIGKKLLNEVEKWAKSNSVRFIQWECLYRNKIAENFCIKNKFKHFKIKMLKRLK